MNHMYVIYSLDTFARKDNVGIVESEEAAKDSIIGLMKTGLIAGYEKVEVWRLKQLKDVSYAIETLMLAKNEYEERMKLMSSDTSRYKRFEKRVEELNNALEILKFHCSLE